jgi:hypothetical protein
MAGITRRLLLVLACWATYSLGMMGKRRLNYDPVSLADEPGRRLRCNVGDVFAHNALPGTRVQSLCNDIGDCGIDEFEALSNSTDTRGTNASRRLRNLFSKDIQWPPVYWAEVRCKAKRSGLVRKEWCAFLLPHEIMYKLTEVGRLEALCNISGLDKGSLEHYRYCQT